MEIKDIWNIDEMRSHLDEFYDLYTKRPIKDNDGGMKSPHMFPSWFIIKKMKPKLIIESGVWKGLGTWFFENASPDSKIVSLDPNPQYRIYTSPKVMYSTQDFSSINWNNNSFDVDDTLVFIDDHQNSLDRVKQCLHFGFSKVIFEDNYPFDQGDCYSIKKILSGKNYCIDSAGRRTYHNAVPSDKEFLENSINYYQEMPPISIGEKTRWGNLWSEYDTPPQILTKDELNKYPDLMKEIWDYTWICYLELKNNNIK